MRNFESDFDFDFGEGIRCEGTADFRYDEHPALVHGTVLLEIMPIPERKSVQVHIKRIRTEKHSKALPLSSLQ